MSFEETLYSLLIYAATFIASCGCVFLSKNKLSRPLFSFLAVLIPAITAAYRESGIDYVAYKSMYISIRRGQGYKSIEGLWYQLNRVMPSFEWLLFVSAFLFLGVSFFAICKFVKDKRTLAWFIFLTVCYSVFYNGMQQMIAVAFFFAAVALMYDRKYIRGFALIAIATLFHTSAFFMFAIPLYLFLSYKVKHAEGLVLFLTGMFAFGIPIVSELLQQIGLFTSYTEEISWNFSLGFILYALPPLIPFYMHYRYVKNDKLVMLAYNLYLMILPFQFLGMSMRYADRVMLYFQVFIAVLVPLFLQAISKKQVKSDWRFLYTLWFVIHYVVLNVVLNGNGTYPYRDFNLF